MATSTGPFNTSIDHVALADRIARSGPETVEEAALVAKSAVRGVRGGVLKRDRDAIRRAVELWAEREGVPL